MRKSKWPPEKTDLLLAMAAEGLCRREIAARMDLNISAVTTKLHLLGVIVPLNAAPESKEQHTNRKCLRVLAAFPSFADITPAEACAVRQGAPRSAPYAREHDFSLTGNAARLCAAF
jgi:hypothetical protein